MIPIFSIIFFGKQSYAFFLFVPINPSFFYHVSLYFFHLTNFMLVKGLIYHQFV